VCGVPVFSTRDEDDTVFDAVEHGGLVFEFVFVFTKVMVVSIHNSITSFLQETSFQFTYKTDVHANRDADR